MDKSSINKYDRPCTDAAERWVVTSINESAKRNTELGQAASRFIERYRNTCLLHRFPYSHSNWRGVKEQETYKSIERLIIKDGSAPIGLSMYTMAFAVRFVIEHFTDEDLFGDRQTKEVVLVPSNGVSALSELNVVNCSTNISQPKELPMSNAIKVETITFVSNGAGTRTAIKDVTLERAIELIKESEKAISDLKDLKAQPKAVVAKILELQAGIDALVKELDSREETK